jgi:peroxiredoxin
VAVVFISNQCPYSCFYIDRLKQIQTQFCKQGFTLVGINAMDANQHPAESFQNMKKFALERQLNFPYLWDPTQDVARSFGAQKTPEAFLIDDLGILRYSGQIDDNVQDAEAIQMTYLQNAIAALLAGEEVMLKSTEVMGCPIQWRH